MTDVLLAGTATHRMSAAPDNNYESNNNTYEPRRSTRINTTTTADGDTWEEKLVVCEAAGKKLVIRSYFQNVRTKRRCWDEPPSGASRIEPASSLDRQEKEAELMNLQAAMDNGPPEDGGKKGISFGKKGKGFFSAFRKTSGKGIFGKKNKKNATTITTRPTIINEEDLEGNEDMQRAISASMGLETPKKSSKKTSPGGGKNSQWQEDQEALDIAKAISISEAQNGGAPQMSSEEAMLQRAIEASRTDTTADPMPASGVASMPPHTPDFLGLSEDFSSEQLTSPQACFEGHDSDSSFFNKKMPAQPSPFSTLPSGSMGPSPPPAHVPAGAAPYASGASLKSAPAPSAGEAAPYTTAAAAAASVGLNPSPPVAAAVPYSSNAGLKPAPVAPNTSLKAPPPQTIATPNSTTAPSRKPAPTPPLQGTTTSTASAFSFDPYARNLNPTATAPAVAAASAGGGGGVTALPAYDAGIQYTSSPPTMDDSSLRKLEGDNGHRKTPKGLVGRIYNKKNVQVKAGVV